MACWLDQGTSNNELCDAIDEIMKQEQEDIMPSDPNLSCATALDLNLDSFSDLLGNPSNLSAAALSPISPSMVNGKSNPPAPTDFSASSNLYELPTRTGRTFSFNSSPSNPNGSSVYSALGIGPKFTSLSINQQHHRFSPPSQETNHSSTLPNFAPSSSMNVNAKTSLHPPPYLQPNNNPNGGPSYSFDLPMNNGPSDVKRFRSASMNEGATQQQQARLDPHLLDPYRMRSVTYVEPSYYHSKGNSSTNTTMTTNSSASSLSADISANTNWPYGSCSRPPSSSFSEVLTHQQPPLRTGINLSTSYGGSSPFSSLHHMPNQTGFSPDPLFQNQPMSNCTLYSLNQPTGTATKPSTSPVPPSSASLTRKHPPLVGFSVDEIKVDPTSPIGPGEQQNERDLWSDIEQNSSDLMHDDDDDDDDDDISSDAETTTTVSTGFHPDVGATKSSQFNMNSQSPFWQYNVQAKGPKTKRILYLKERDPHLHREFSDPVYQIKLTQTRGQSLTKLRKGDGNDVTPNPMKLYQLGKQIRDLSSFVSKPNSTPASVYHGIYHFETQSNNNDSAEVKKEKNKIASRACRLRKKAQHEANKLKLHGLNEEHRTLMDLITSIKLLILKRYHDGQLNSPPSSPNQTLELVCEQLIANKYSQAVAGNTDAFVQGIVNDIENLYASKQHRSQSLTT